MAEVSTTTGSAPRWVHYWAVLTAAVTLPLLLLGAEVTTKQVGMVDPYWPTPPWQLWITSWRDSGLGFLIEHGHRLAGYTVGTCTIVLMLSLWLFEPRRWLRWLGVAAFTGVCIQGVLGGLRVRLHALFGEDLALVHGCFGQMVFALLATLAVCTSRRWAEPSQSLPAEETGGVRRWSSIVVALLLLQLVLGALLRHQGSALGQRGHLLVAFAVVAAVVALAWHWRAASERMPGALKLLLGLIALQVMLGVEAWTTKFSVPAYAVVEPHPLGRDLVRSAHVLVGALVLASAVVVALEAHRGRLRASIELPGLPESLKRAGNLSYETETQVIDLSEGSQRQVGNLPHKTEAVTAGRQEGA